MSALLAIVLFGAPAVGFWLLASGLDPIGRLVMATLASLLTLSSVALVMLIAGIWSPQGGFLAVLLLSAALAGLSRLRRTSTAVPASAAPPAPQIPQPAGPPKPGDLETRHDLPTFDPPAPGGTRPLPEPPQP